MDNIEQNQNNGKTILFVEDDNFFTGLLAKKISSAGFAVEHASTGTEAMQMIKTKAPSLVVLDIILPEMDGFEVLRQIKTDEATKNIPVIMLSNLGSKEQLEKAKTFGAHSFMIKATVSLDQVVKQISSALSV